MALSRGTEPAGSRVNPMKGRVVRVGDDRASAGNVANIVTVARILLAPVFVVLLLLDAGSDGLFRYLAGALFILASATDGVDGLLARRRNLVTDAGKLLDPIADKVLIGGALVTLSVLGELPWWVTAVVLVREVGITVLRFAVVRDRVIPASILGKVKTWAQIVAISFAIVPLLHALLGDAAHVLDAVLMSIAVALTVVSGVEYLWQAWRVRRTRAGS